MHPRAGASLRDRYKRAFLADDTHPSTVGPAAGIASSQQGAGTFTDGAASARVASLAATDSIALSSTFAFEDDSALLQDALTKRRMRNLLQLQTGSAAAAATNQAQQQQQEGNRTLADAIGNAAASAGVDRHHCHLLPVATAQTSGQGGGAAGSSGRGAAAEKRVGDDVDGDGDDLWDFDEDEEAGGVDEEAGGSGEERAEGSEQQGGGGGPRPVKKRKAQPSRRQRQPGGVLAAAGGSSGQAGNDKRAAKKPRVFSDPADGMGPQKGGGGAASFFAPGEEVVLPLGATCRGQLTDEPIEADLLLHVPGNINKYLRDYQREGVRFLFAQYAKGKGGVLADDMGLGKTIQTIAFLAALLGKQGDVRDQELSTSGRHPVLVVCPTSVITNWERELRMWGRFHIGSYTGSARAAVLEAAQAKRVEVMLVSYDTFRLQVETLREVDWHAVVFDEAHKLKNKKAKVYEAVETLRTPLRYGLTGTLMSNSYEELWAIMELLAPGSMGVDSHKEFDKKYVEPMRQGQRADADEWTLKAGRRAQDKMQKRLRGCMLRRTKALIAGQLPEKRDNIVYCRLSILQVRAYLRALHCPDFQLLVRYSEDCDCGSGLKRASCCHKHVHPEQGGVLWPRYHLCECDNEYDALSNPKGCKHHKPEGCPHFPGCPFCLSLPCLTLLQKVSNHIDLLKLDPKDVPAMSEADLVFQEDVLDMMLGDDLEAAGGPYLGSTFLSASSESERCGKMAALDGLLATWRSQPGDKVLVFSHSCRMLDVVERLVTLRGYSYLRLDGSTPQPERQKRVDEFNRSPGLYCFLISTTAGGLGLNLTGANRVIIVDPSWNPAHDLQAQDRAFRIGQFRDVSVYRLVAAGTLEEMIYTRQIYKQQQEKAALAGSRERRHFVGVQNDRNNQGELFGLANLFSLAIDRIRSLDILESTKQREKDDHLTYQVEAADVAAAVGNASDQGGGGGGGRVAADGCTAGPAGPHVAGADDPDDAGLGDLAAQMVHAMAAGGVEQEEGEEGAQRGADGAGAGDGGGDDRGAGGGGCGDDGQVEPNEEGQQGASGKAPAAVASGGGGGGLADDQALALGLPGVIGAALHDQALGSSALEEHLAERAAREEQDVLEHVPSPMRAALPEAALEELATALLRNKAGAGRGTAGSRGRGRGRRRPAAVRPPHPGYLSAVESLAEWKGEDVRDMARQLLGMTPEGRRQLMDEYDMDPVNQAESLAWWKGVQVQDMVRMLRDMTPEEKKQLIDEYERDPRNNVA